MIPGKQKICLLNSNGVKGKFISSACNLFLLFLNWHLYLDLCTKHIVANKVFGDVIVDISLKFLCPFSFIVVDTCLWEHPQCVLKTMLSFSVLTRHRFVHCVERGLIQKIQHRWLYRHRCSLNRKIISLAYTAASMHGRDVFLYIFLYCLKAHSTQCLNTAEKITN